MSDSCTGDSDRIDEAIRVIASEKTDIEDRMPQGAKPGSTDEAYNHGRWRGLKFALETLQDIRQQDTDSAQSTGSDPHPDAGGGRS